MGWLNRTKSEEQYAKEWMNAYNEISRLTGVRLEDTVNHSYGLVINSDHELFGKVGVYQYSEFSGLKNFGYYKFGRTIVKLQEGVDVYSATNVCVIIEEKKRLGRLF